MSFQAYLDTILKQTGKTPSAIYEDAKQAKVITPSLTATAWVAWLQNRYQVGRGHAMALWKYFVEKGWIQPVQSKLKKK
jgi:hypothetical protein